MIATKPLFEATSVNNVDFPYIFIALFTNIADILFLKIIEDLPYYPLNKLNFRTLILELICQGQLNCQ